MDEIKKYQPSSGTEGDIFMAAFCEKCKKMDFQDDDAEPCPILGLTMMLQSIEHEDYPEEWRYNADGKPTCTAFVHEDSDDDAAPRCPDTPDMFA